MKTKFVIILFLMLSIQTFAQTNTSFTVFGDLDKYYPVKFNDANWSINKATEIEIGRSGIHINSSLRGSLMAKFTYHVSNWGNGSSFINVENISSNELIGGWKDATTNNNDNFIIIWLRGGNTTYFLSSLANITSEVYDGVHYALPLLETNGPSYSYLTTPDSYVSNYGMVSNLTAHFYSVDNNFFNGSVGIGTTTPTQKLEVNGNIKAANFIGNLSGNASNADLHAGWGQAFGTEGTTLAGVLGLDGLTPSYQWYGAGKLKTMLGIPNEGETLQSISGRNATTSHMLTVEKDVSGVEPTLLSLKGTGPSPRLLQLGTSTSGYSYIQSQHATVSYSDTPLSLQPNGGNVGVGTTNPFAKFHLAEDANTSGAPNNAQLLIGGRTNPEKHISLAYNTSSNYGEIQSQAYNAGYTNLVFNPNGGNVGIGTTAATEKLTVKGKIQAEEIRVKAANVPDYVFEENYNLLSLSEIEKYVKTEKHLPEVPSAKEFEKNGMEVGEMNKLLLKKIEELTLLMIEQGKVVEKLKEDVIKLKAQK